MIKKFYRCLLQTFYVISAQQYKSENQRRIQNLEIGGLGSGRVRCPSPAKFLEILSKNNAFLRELFTIFEMHPVNRKEAAPRAPFLSFESATGENHVYCKTEMF